VGAFETIARSEQEFHERRFERVVGNSPALEAVLEQVDRVAPTRSTVLIEGETGTGKELIAHAIHNISSRCGRSFVRLNCAAIPLDLLESELFGYEKGAFTGAIAQKIGRFELADKGTLFLDEVGDIPPALQPKLLRVLQEQEFERLGSTRAHQVDVRLVAAESRSRGDGESRPISQRPLLPTECLPRAVAAVAGAFRRCSRLSDALCRDFWFADGSENRAHSCRNDVCTQFLPVAGEHPRAAEPDRARRYSFKKWCASRSFANHRDAACSGLDSCNDSEGIRALFDSANARGSPLGDRRPKGRGRCTGPEAHYLDSQDA
jgi:hypothetical protein